MIFTKSACNAHDEVSSSKLDHAILKQICGKSKRKILPLTFVARNVKMIGAKYLVAILRII
jgi:hypothetical protein